MDILKVKTNNKEEIVDITSQIRNIIKNKNGNACLVYSKHTTASIIINENDDSKVGEDILHSLDELVPRNNGWKHRCDKDNAHAHVKSSFLGPSKLIPIKNGKLELGRWQGIFLVELDGPREREVAVNIL